MNILFWINRSRHKNLYCRLSKQGYKRREIATGLHIDPKLWTNSYTLAKGTGNEAMIVNQELQLIKFKIDNIILDLKKKSDQAITPQIVKGIYEGKGMDRTDQAMIFINAIDEAMPYVYHGLASNSIKAYKNTVNVFKAFLATQSLSDTNTHDIGKSIAERYIKYMRKAGNSFNTIGQKITRMGTIFESIQENIECRMPASNPFKMKIKKMTTEIDATQNENKWIDKDCQDKLEQAKLDSKFDYIRKMFLFQVHTGLAWVDMMQFDPQSHIVFDTSGVKWIRLRRTKTMKSGQYSEIPVSEQTTELIGFFEANRIGAFIKKIRYQLYLTRLNELGKQLDLPHITTHMGRHTFGVRMLEAGISMEAVSHMMGHSSIKITESIYAKVSKRKISMETEKARQAGLL